MGLAACAVHEGVYGPRGALVRPDPMGVALLLAGASLAVYMLIALWVAGLVP